MKKVLSAKKQNNEKVCTLIEKTKPYRYYILVAIIAFLSGFIIKSVTTNPSKINTAAIVDVQKLINNSADIKELQADIAKKQEDLQKWVKEAHDKISKYKEGDAKKKLIAEYEAEFEQKQQEIQNEYNEKLSQIDKKATKVINKVSKSKGYGIVLTKSSVITGGSDITDEIIDILK
ncbi:MAG: OmpH family outer membrane protein [Alphaproteobacteria bacterium]|nr:OmpH family outer membrane protein [Alphaproteobacteria bacterium]